MSDDTYKSSFHRFSLGKAVVSTIHDGAHIRDTINPPFMLEKPDEEIAQIAALNHLPTQGFENGYTPTIIRIGGQMILFDTGFAPEGTDAPVGHLKRRLGHAGYTPEDIDIVAFTHCHPDHILGVMDGDAPTYPNARYVIGRQEYDAWLSGAGIPEQRAGTRDIFLKLIPPLADRMTFLEDGDSVVPGLTAEAAFGHSPGHMMYRLESEGKSLLIWGDVTNHFVFSLQYPDSLVGFDDDKDRAIATRNRVLDMVATDGLLVSGFHMPFPCLGYVERLGGQYRWTPVSYQTRM
ncbi:MAG: MBL fold metallo-hydrolase [Paracoccaceae bacterium]